MLSVVKNPITVVPWNGFAGAATFTFDDGTESQTRNLDFLEELPEAKVTFFVCSKSGYFGEGHREKHLELARRGHELGNHTVNHLNLTDPGVDYKAEIYESAKALRSMGLDVASFATPYCAQNEVVKVAINQDHFISRSCNGIGLCNWDVEPDWMEIPSKDWPEHNGDVDEFKESLNQAAAGKWLVQLFHGVGGDWFSIEPADLEALIRYAVGKNLWVAAFSQVGAYYRAHFAMESAVCENTSAGLRVSWLCPHSRMPKSVPLLVKIEGADGRSVVQNGKAILPNQDGYYIIEFMDLGLLIV